MFKKKVNSENTERKNKRTGCRRAAAFLLAVIVIAGTVYSTFGGFSTGPCADTDEFAKYATEIKDIKIPEGTRVLALGEATHGNREFQELKLEVFELAVEKYGVRAFALEANYGECEEVNRYIHGGKGKPEDYAGKLGFTLYNTDEMAAVIKYMRDFNQTAKDGDDIRLYGFDMQSYELCHKHLVEAAKAERLDTTELEKLMDKEEYSDKFTTAERKAVISDIRSKLIAVGAPANEVMLADILLQNADLVEAYASGDQSAPLITRDKLMADNLLWISKQEEWRGNNMIFATGHNGHVEQNGCYDEEHKVMGALVAEQLGDGYYVIGTDFYHAKVNMPYNSGKRANHRFYSHDPLAKAAKKCGYEMCWLDFSAVPEDSALRAVCDDYCYMGSLGEGYSRFLSRIPLAYRVLRAPAQTYDSMILVSNANPTSPK